MEMGFSPWIDYNLEMPQVSPEHVLALAIVDQPGSACEGVV
jgi:hypothetical protein